MQQLDFFDETLHKKIYRLEKWIYRLNKEMIFLKEVYNMRKKLGNFDISPKHIQQIDMFQ